MENRIFGLLALLSLLAFIKRVKDAWFTKTTETKFEETRPPSFELPEKIDEIHLDEEQCKERVWNALNRLHKVANWRCGVFETEQYIDTYFHIEDNRDAIYRYRIDQGELHFNVVILFSFPVEVTTDLFVLAAHFNNLVTLGKVVVDVNKQNVIFSYQNDLSLYAVFPDRIETHISRHFYISRDVNWAFQKYLLDREEPVMIISELLNRKDKQQENSENQ